MCNIVVKGLWKNILYAYFYEPNGFKYFTVQQAAAEKKPSVAAFKRRLRHTQLLLLHSFAAKRSRKEGSIKSVSVYEILT